MSELHPHVLVDNLCSLKAPLPTLSWPRSGQKCRCARAAATNRDNIASGILRPHCVDGAHHRSGGVYSERMEAVYEGRMLPPRRDSKEDHKVARFQHGHVVIGQVDGDLRIALRRKHLLHFGEVPRQDCWPLPGGGPRETAYAEWHRRRCRRKGCARCGGAREPCCLQRMHTGSPAAPTTPLGTVLN